ncbi:cytochrome P450 CYP72A219-like isoform X2 [Asparagus officinalis]|uniref:cytochrome P450 CYP72A219-like isoform X2 n=1 Tax=Asparagus officinalis TaxID=4686 RepID=UPI00098E1A45|nr:cytochrome P450 CYP72A219-like isoform X2 [Asparagus officinalis]
MSQQESQRLHLGLENQLKTAPCCNSYYSLWWKPKRLEKHLRQQGIKGNPYKVLYGDTKEELERFKEAWSRPMDELNHQILPRVVPFTHQMVQKYGKMCNIWVGPTPWVLIWDTEMVKEVFSDKSGCIKKPPANPLIKILAQGVDSLEGEEWAKRRKTITLAFHLEKLKRMVPAFVTSCTSLIKRWDDLVSAQGSSEVDVWPEFQILTKDAISRTAFGSTYEEGKRLFQLQKEQAELAMQAAQVPYVPGYRFIPTATNRRRMWIDKEIKTMLRRMIDEKLKSVETEGSDSNDLLGLLLRFTSGNDKKHAIRIEDVIEECKLFYFAGQETTSTLLTWTLLLLSMHPVWQQRAREEVQRTCGKNTPDMESLNQLKAVSMILHEVLRLYPPVTFLLRQTYKKTKLGEFYFPPGVVLALPIILIHHDTEIWGDDAEEFNPERFSQGISKACQGGQNAFYPFGWGPISCLGQSFAMIEAKMALATILQHFSFELSPSYAHAPYNAVTLQPQHGAHIILHRL